MKNEVSHGGKKSDEVEVHESKDNSSEKGILTRACCHETEWKRNVVKCQDQLKAKRGLGPLIPTHFLNLFPSQSRQSENKCTSFDEAHIEA